MKPICRAAIALGMLSVCGCPQVGPITTPDIVDAIIAASATRGPGPLTVSFSGASSVSQAGAITGYAWDFAGEGTSADAATTFTFTAPGRYPVKLTATDAAGNVGVEILDIRVQGENPTAVISVNVDSGTSPLLVNFNATDSHAPDDTILDYYWDFDDGETSRAATPQHLFTFDGQFTVTLRVVTAGGAEGATTAIITVTDGIASLQFDGMQLATLPVTPAQTLAEFTVEAWCRADPRGGTLVDIGDRALLLDVVPESNVIRLRRAMETFEVTAAGLGGKWVHIALVYDGSEVAIVVNGTLLDSFAVIGDLAIASLVIGTAFEGRIADVRLWSVARTTAEINTLALTRLSGNENRLIGYWPINEGSGEVLRNLAFGGVDGTLGSSDAAEASDPAWIADGPPF